MKIMRTLLLAVATVGLFVACGGSDNGDVTIATDDPPPGSKANPVQSAPVAADAARDRAVANPSSDQIDSSARRAAGTPES